MENTYVSFDVVKIELCQAAACFYLLRGFYG